jgi:hypothetical protein
VHDAVAGALDRFGLLLLQDARLPSVATLVAGAPVRGSWWGHPAGKAIYDACQQLAGSDDVLTAKLVCGKVTFVERRHWPALVAAARAREPWQTDGLSPDAARLLERVEASERVRASGKPARELESRLLVCGREVHTGSGAHASELETWARFARRRSVAPAPGGAAAARRALEAAAVELSAGSGARVWLPWQ